MAPSISSGCVCLLLLQLGKEGKLKLGSVRHFVLDECDKMLDKLGAYLGCSMLNFLSVLHTTSRCCNL